MLNKRDLQRLEREIISFLNKQLQNAGDISEIANKFIDGDKDNLKRVRDEIIDLTVRDILYIKYESHTESLHKSGNWWGNLRAEEFLGGIKIQGLYAKLSNGHLSRSREKKETLISEILKGAITAIFSILVGTLLWYAQNSDKIETDHQQNTSITNLRDSLNKLSAQVDSLVKR